MPRKKMLDMLQTALHAEAGMKNGILEILSPVETLTDRQFECLKFIYLYFIERRYYPTQKEIAAGLGVKSNTAAFFTGPMQKKGYLYVEQGRHRNIRLTQLAIELLREKKIITEAAQMQLPV